MRGPTLGKETNRQLVFRTLSFNLMLISSVTLRLYCKCAQGELRCQGKKGDDRRDVCGNEGEQ